MFNLRVVSELRVFGMGIRGTPSPPPPPSHKISGHIKCVFRDSSEAISSKLILTSGSVEQPANPVPMGFGLCVSLVCNTFRFQILPMAGGHWGLCWTAVLSFTSLVFTSCLLGIL